MTKPHTTLSEAVRAMNRAKLLPVWDDINHKLHAELDIIFKALDAAALVEQHEAQEPVLKARQEGRMEALAVILHQDPENPFNDQVYTGQDHSGDYSTAWNEEALRKLLAIDDAAYNAFDKAEAQYWEYRYHAFECEIAAKERREQPTLAATQAGDVKVISIGHGATLQRQAKTTGAVGWLMYNEHGLVRSLDVFETQLVESALAAMSPTTTRSE